MSKRQFKNSGVSSYVISPVDNLDKFSNTYANCTGVIVAGINKNTGENISFMSHQDPGYFLISDEAKEKFKTDLVERLREMKEKCKPGTLDAIILGENYFKGVHRSGANASLAEDYITSIKLLSSEINNVLNFEPTVMTGPKRTPREDDVFYDNNNRRVYIQRPTVGNSTTDSYQPKDIDEKKKEWQLSRSRTNALVL